VSPSAVLERAEQEEAGRQGDVEARSAPTVCGHKWRRTAYEHSGDYQSASAWSGQCIQLRLIQLR